MTTIIQKIRDFPPRYLLILALIGLGLAYNFSGILPLEPQGRHHWRQTDCASFAWNYYNGNGNLFTPAMNNVLSNGKGQAVAEFPVIYWVSGMLYRLFGPHVFILRLINILIVFSGLWALSGICKNLIDDSFWSIFIPLLVYTSPFFVYYSSGFIPDPPAIALCMWAWYFISAYILSKKKKHFIVAILFFTLAALIKVSAAISIVVCVIIVLGNRLIYSRLKNGNPSVFYQKTWVYLLYFLGAVMVIITWYMYASWYSTRFEYNHFTGIIRPIYQTSTENITRILRDIRTQLPYFYMPTMHIFLGGLFVYIITQYKKVRYELLIIPILLSIGGFIYLSIFFQLIGGHEYYHLINMLAVASILIVSAYIFSNKHPNISQHWITRTLLIGFLLANVLYSREKMKEYYDPNNAYHREKTAFYEDDFRQYLSSIGLKEDQYIISIPDRSPNNTLYLLKKRGWSSFNNPKHYGEVMQKWTGNFGDIFLIVSDSTTLSDSLLQPALYHKIGTYQEIQIYLLEKK
ncbi:MAG: glycosyltransferase family 39 protein [Bacteroidia bacterium]